MSGLGSFFERGNDIVNLFHQTDANSDITGDWINVENHPRVAILIVKGGSEDVDDLNIQIQQANDATGTGAKAVNVKRVYAKSGAFTGVNTWSDVSLATEDDLIGVGASLPTGTSRVLADVNTGAFQLLIDIPTEQLDANNGFKFVTAFVEGDNADNAVLLSAWIILMDSRYPQAIPLTCLS